MKLKELIQRYDHLAKATIESMCKISAESDDEEGAKILAVHMIASELFRAMGDEDTPAQLQLQLNQIISVMSVKESLN